MKGVAAALAALTFAGAVQASVGSGGATVVLPKGWQALAQSTPPPGMRVEEPVTRIVVASASIYFGKGCNDLDYAFSAAAVALVVVEWVRPTPGARFAPRPRHFTPTTLPVLKPPAIECFDGPGGSVQFADHGRRFAAYILLGRHAPPRLAERARAVLDTLKVTKPGS